MITFLCRCIREISSGSLWQELVATLPTLGLRSLRTQTGCRLESSLASIPLHVREERRRDNKLTARRSPRAPLQSMLRRARDDERPCTRITDSSQPLPPPPSHDRQPCVRGEDSSNISTIAGPVQVSTPTMLIKKTPPGPRVCARRSTSCGSA